MEQQSLVLTEEEIKRGLRRYLLPNEIAVWRDIVNKLSKRQTELPFYRKTWCDWLTTLPHHKPTQGSCLDNFPSGGLKTDPYKLVQFFNGLIPADFFEPKEFFSAEGGAPNPKVLTESQILERHKNYLNTLIYIRDHLDEFITNYRKFGKTKLKKLTPQPATPNPQEIKTKPAVLATPSSPIKLGEETKAFPSTYTAVNEYLQNLPSSVRDKIQFITHTPFAPTTTKRDLCKLFVPEFFDNQTQCVNNYREPVGFKRDDFVSGAHKYYQIPKFLSQKRLQQNLTWSNEQFEQQLDSVIDKIRQKYSNYDYYTLPKTTKKPEKVKPSSPPPLLPWSSSQLIPTPPPTGLTPSLFPPPSLTSVSSLSTSISPPSPALPPLIPLDKGGYIDPQAFTGFLSPTENIGTFPTGFFLLGCCRDNFH